MLAFAGLVEIGLGVLAGALLMGGEVQRDDLEQVVVYFGVDSALK